MNTSTTAPGKIHQHHHRRDTSWAAHLSSMNLIVREIKRCGLHKMADYVLTVVCSWPRTFSAAFIKNLCNLNHWRVLSRHCWCRNFSILTAPGFRKDVTHTHTHTQTDYCNPLHMRAIIILLTHLFSGASGADSQVMTHRKWRNLYLRLATQAVKG